MRALTVAALLVVAFTAAGVAVRLIAAWSPLVAAALIAYWVWLPLYLARRELRG